MCKFTEKQLFVLQKILNWTESVLGPIINHMISRQEFIRAISGPPTATNVPFKYTMAAVLYITAPRATLAREFPRIVQEEQQKTVEKESQSRDNLNRLVRRRGVVACSATWARWLFWTLFKRLDCVQHSGEGGEERTHTHIESCVRHFCVLLHRR